MRRVSGCFIISIIGYTDDTCIGVRLQRGLGRFIISIIGYTDDTNLRRLLAFAL